MYQFVHIYDIILMLIYSIFFGICGAKSSGMSFSERRMQVQLARYCCLVVLRSQVIEPY